MTWNYIKPSSDTYEHRIIAELALGKSLPDKAEIHHIDGDGTNNDRSNLVICNDRAHHMWIHYRQRAYEACGNANFVKCEYCKEYDDPSNNMYTQRRKYGFRARHRSCHAEANRRIG